MEKFNFGNKGDVNAKPMNNTNMNILQANIENAINEVVESGNNETGIYVKFASGTLITIHQVNQYLARTSAWGNMYETTQPANLGSYPIEFKYTPYIFLTLFNNNALFEAVKDTTKTSAGNVYLIAPTANESQVYTIQVLAIGRWK